MSHERVVRRCCDKMTHCEAKASNGDHSHNPVSDEDLALMSLVGVKCDGETDHDDAILKSLDCGKTHDWDKKPVVCFWSNVNFFDV